MAPKKNYSRYFIILQEEERGYAYDNEKIPSGYVKLENKNEKCKVSCYVQNLSVKMQPYYMVLICSKKDTKKIINLGKVKIDNYGRVDQSSEYDYDDIAKTALSMDKIVGAALVKIVDRNIISLMSGFIASEVPSGWKSFELVSNTDEETDIKENIFEKYEATIEDKKLNRINQEKNDNNEKQNETKQELDVAEEELQESNLTEKEHTNKLESEDDNQIRTIENEVIEEIDKKDGNNEISNKNQDVTNENELKESANNKTSEEDITEDNTRNSSSGAMGEFFESIVKDYDKVAYMGDDIKECTWYKVPIDNIETMYDMSDYDKYTVLYYPMLCYYSYIGKHNHYCIGYKYDNKGRPKYLVYAIPGTKAKIDQPYGGKTGFVTWLPSEHRKETGYWVMFYDIKNSTVVIPIKKSND